MVAAGGQAIPSKSRPNAVLSTRGPMAVLSRQNGWPDLQISTTNSIFAFIPHDQFISGQAKLFLAKASPMAVLSTRGPDLQISATNCIFGIIPHDQFITGRAKLFSAKAGPMAVLFLRGPMAVLSRQNGWPDLQISTTNSIFAFIPQGQAILSKSKPNGRFINARPNGRFIKAEANGWPDLQISATNCIFGIIPHDQFITGRAKLFSAKASPMAVLSTRGPMAVLSRQNGWPDFQISATNCILISLSAVGPSYS